MDSADPKTLHAALSAQGVRIFHHEEQLGLISQGVKELVGRQAELQDSVSSQIQQLTDHMHQFIAHLQTTPPVTSSTAFLSRILLTLSNRSRLFLHYGWLFRRDSPETPSTAEPSLCSAICIFNTIQGLFHQTMLKWRLPCPI
ncbi:hypothetical protein CesoFtcFv8_019671 [Champsocephalus esox]|uniref:Uncharacterized protein n=2 Tax=Champsocephalus TaxID=52236 RepID=A0AAN8CZR7_CHAGU|nr:hypothetical protein CesoFtcFv8_019671 [Champsocephalus esox]KAK5910938.1 hypothetical protein CgunFtcFv8_005155 [Champsocephalus gunnari]